MQTEENHKRLLRLLNLTDREKILDNEFQYYVKLAKGYAVWFKLRYNLPITDPRFKEATDSEIFEDALIEDAVDYVEKFESHDQDTNEFAKRHVLNPQKASEDERKKDSEMLMRFLKS